MENTNLTGPQATVIAAAIALLGAAFGHWLAYLDKRDARAAKKPKEA